jgi:uncharacterized membrane protein
MTALEMLGIILLFLGGLLAGASLESGYRSIQARQFILPRFVNIQMYGFTAIFLYLLHIMRLNPIIEILLIIIFPTLIELTTGYIAFTRKGIRSWDYSKYRFNYRGFICLQFSIIWAILAFLTYYFLIPLFT